MFWRRNGRASRRVVTPPWLVGDPRDARASKAWWLLWPLTWVVSRGFLLVVLVRNLAYRRRWMTIKELPCRVLSVGNIRVGGTGKTPFTVWLCRRLAERGYRVGVIGHAYGGKSEGPTLVPDAAHSAEPSIVGDEAVLLAKSVGNRLCVGRDRFDAGMLLLKEDKADVLVVEDGFQHRQLKRDLDIVLLDAWSGFFATCLLPAGPLREPRSSLRRADILLVLKGDKSDKHRLKNGLQRQFGRLSVFEAELEPTCLTTWEADNWRELPLSVIVGRKVLAVSGIASPGSFYEMIRDWEGEIVDVMEFPDHHSYSNADWKVIVNGSRNADLIVTTEKDLVKLGRFPFPRGKLCAIRVEVKVDRERELLNEIEERARLKGGADKGPGRFGGQ